MSKDDELALLVIDEALMHELNSHFEEDCDIAVEMRAEDYRRRDALRKVTAKFLGLFRQQM